MKTEIDWIWGMILFPVVIGLFKSELGKLWTAWRVSVLREFDVGKPVEVQSGATGKWGRIEILDYNFSFSTKKRGVKIQYPNGAIETISLIAWSKMRKRTPADKEISGNFN